MIKDLQTKNNEARLIISKDLFGLGLSINFKNAITIREINYVISFDFVCVRFWWVNYKRLK